jgi:toxin ParE1/3/4
MIRRRPRAIEALIESAEYIGADSPASAERFLLAADRTFRQLEEMPGMGHIYESNNPKLNGIRVWAVKGFRNHLIFYRAINDGIDVLTVLHGAQDLDNVLPRELT